MKRYPILTFHSVDDSDAVISLSPGDFRRIAAELAGAGWRGCTVSELFAARAAGAADRLVALTFDDGYGSVATQAAPVLDDLGFRATVLAVTGRCGADNAWPGQPASVPRMPLMGWDELGTLLAGGWEVASHCVEHLPLTTLTDDAIEEQLGTATEQIGRRLGVAVPLMAYPYGAHDARVRALVARHHDAALGVRLKAATDADLDEPYAIPRIDAYYLRTLSARRALESPIGRGYLALRRWARRFRSPDWTSVSEERGAK